MFGRRRAVAAALATAAITAVSAAPALASPRLGARTLHKGMAGGDVRTLQNDLTASGFWTFPSGVFSEGTQIHVKRFQHAYRLSADGVVGPATVRRLHWAMRRYARSHHRSGARSTAQTTPAASSDAVSATPASGGSAMAPPPNNSPAEAATLNSQGLAVAPADAPQVVREVIAAANKIAFKPYVYGGGHGSFDSSGYDCSGSVSYALHGGGLLSTPYDSTQFESYGGAGAGNWLTLYANGGHVYMDIAGLWFDTADQSSRNNNDRWSVSRVSPASGFIVRHPRGW